MSQETAFRDVVDELCSRGSRFAREAYVFVVAALGETVRQLPAGNLHHLSVDGLHGTRRQTRDRSDVGQIFIGPREMKEYIGDSFNA